MKGYTKQQTFALIVTWIVAVFFLQYFITQPILAYIGESYPDKTVTQITELSTLPNLIGMFISFVIGPLAMKISKKLLVGLIPASILCYMIIFYFFGTSGPFWVLQLACVIVGYAQGSISVLGPIAISGIVEPEKRSRCYSIMVGAQNAGLFVWLNLAGVIGSRNGGANWNNVYLLGFILVPVVIAFFIFYPKDSETSKFANLGVGKHADDSDLKGLAGLKTIPPIIIFMVFVQCFYYVCNSAFAQNISVFVINEHQIGTSVHTGFATSCMRLAGVVMAIAFPLMKKIFKRYLIPAGYGIVLLGLFLTVATKNVAFACIGAFLCGFGNTVAFSELYTYVGNKSGKYGPVSISFLQGMNNLGVYLTPHILLAGANMLGGESATNKMWAGCAVGVICVILALLIYPREMKKDMEWEAAHADNK